MNEPILAGAVDIMRQGLILLQALDDSTYTQKLPSAFNASVGGHYRHCLDHFQSLLLALDADEVNYDARKRDPRIETDRAFAMAETLRLLESCESISAELLAHPISMRCRVSYAHTEDAVVSSTLGRELIYSVAHAIHHYALIGIMCNLMAVSIPAGFGVAPSTLKHREDEAKAAKQSLH